MLLASGGRLGQAVDGFCIALLIVDGGVHRVIAFDPQEAPHARARDEGIEIADLPRDADVVVAITGRAGLIEPSMVREGR